MRATYGSRAGHYPGSRRNKRAGDYWVGCARGPRAVGARLRRSTRVPAPSATTTAIPTARRITPVFESLFCDVAFAVSAVHAGRKSADDGSERTCHVDPPSVDLSRFSCAYAYTVLSCA